MQRNRFLVVALGTAALIVGLLWVMRPARPPESDPMVPVEDPRAPSAEGREAPLRGSTPTAPVANAGQPAGSADPARLPSAGSTGTVAPPAAPSMGTPSGGSVVAAPPALSPNARSDGGVYPLDRDGIRAAVRSGLPEMKDCYEEWLKVQPSLGGRVLVRFTIDTDDAVEGRVTKAQLVEDGGMGHLAMEGCVLSVMSGLRFEAPLNGTIDVTYPLVFASTDGG